MYQKVLNNIKLPEIMGILNLTEDSFSDGGCYLSDAAALEQAGKLVRDGATILDLGAESTRPGSMEISAELEWQRLAPVLSEIKLTHPSISISIDTQKASVAGQAIALGADIINDISALQFDPDMAEVLSTAKHVKVVLMHMQGRPQTMQFAPRYTDVVKEVYQFLEQRINYAEQCGITKDRIIVDPGIGFGKTLQHNLLLLKHLDVFHELGCAVLLGASRKRFIDQIYPADVHHRIGGSLASAMLACLCGVQMIRVHDVLEHAQFIRTLAALNTVGEL